MNNRSEFEHKATLVKKLDSSAESGQAIVIIALVMVILLGMLGLAIDGGGLFFLQRDAQNATDAAVLSASYAICTKGDPVAAGLATFAQNGFNNNGITNTVTINYPPKEGEGMGDSQYVEVMLEAHKPAYFIQVVYRHPLIVKTRAIGNCLPPFDPSNIPGLWAGSTTCNDTISWTGSNASITGGMFSNKDMKFQGSDIVVSNGAIEAVNVIDGNNVTYDPTYPPTQGVPPQADPLNLNIGLYAPGGEVTVTIPSDLYHAIPAMPATFDPDEYKVNNKGVGTWTPDMNTVIEGLYFVDGDVVVSQHVTVGAQGVSIVATGSIDFSGIAIPSGDAKNPNPVEYYKGVMNETLTGVRYPGIFVYSTKVEMDCGTNDAALKVSGNVAKFYGIVYAPTAHIKLSGSDLYFRGTIIGQTIAYSGSEGEIYYDPSLLPPRPPRIQMVE